jgi:DNA-binding XRE family transcriptional regulator/quercetin dioxygenase-like cupin family protein
MLHSVPDLPSLGARIRAERLRRDVSVRELARRVGVSASLISQIETEKSQPSVSTLYGITTALGISIESVFEPPEPVPASAAAHAADSADGTGGMGVVASLGGVGRDAGVAGRPTVLEALGSGRGRRLGPVVTPGDRQRLTLDTGVVWERLGELPPRSVDFLRVTYPPGGSSSSAGGLMRHPGAEFGFLESGELILTLGFDEIVLRTGDAVSFESTIPHRYRNDGTEPAVGSWFVLER